MGEFKRITIMGLGLMGGSMALGLKQRGFQGEIIGWDHSLDTLEQAKSSGAVDRVCEEPRDAVKETELVILATPVGAYGEILEKTASFLPKKVIVTDVGSVKGSVKRVMDSQLPKDIVFIGGHPMAGSEKAGFAAADPDLYRKAKYFLTPGPDVEKAALDKMVGFVKALGADPVVVDTKEHDRIVALVSHIPQLSAVLLSSMLEGEEVRGYSSFAAGGFKDSTRIASGDPQMWKDIFLLNKKEVLSGIETLEGLLMEFKTHLEEGNEEEILSRLKRAKAIRDGISQG